LAEEDIVNLTTIDLKNKNLKDKHLLETEEITSTRVEISGALGPRAVALTNLPRNMTHHDVMRFV